MKSSRFIPLSLCLFFQAVAIAEPQAVSEKNRKRDDEAGDPSSRKDRPMFKAWKIIDLDGDGKLTLDEFKKLERIASLPDDKQALIFARLDKNSNSAIEPNELHFMPDGGKNERFFPNLRQIDTNEDKQISFEEFTGSPVVKRLPVERQRQMFDNMDHNKDGFLSPADRPDGDRPIKPGIRGGFPDKKFPPNGEKRPLHDTRMSFPQIDTNQDGKLTFLEFQAVPFMKNLGEDEQEDRFESIDANKDLLLSPEEWQQQAMRKPSPPADLQHPQRPNKDDQSGDPEMMNE